MKKRRLKIKKKKKKTIEEDEKIVPDFVDVCSKAPRVFLVVDYLVNQKYPFFFSGLMNRES